MLGHRGSAGAEALLAASEAELEKRAGEFEDRHLATLVWAWGRLRHVPGGRAAAAVRREAAERAAGLDPQALRMLATVGVREETGRRCWLLDPSSAVPWVSNLLSCFHGQSRLELTLAGTRWTLQGFAALHLDPGPQLAPKLAARGVEVAQLMRPPECAGVLESWLALGLRDEARQLLERLAATPAGDGSRGSKSGGGASLLDAAAEAAPPSTAIRLLLAMAVLGDYPETAFAKVGVSATLLWKAYTRLVQGNGSASTISRSLHTPALRRCARGSRQPRPSTTSRGRTCCCWGRRWMRQTRRTGHGSKSTPVF